MSTETAEAFLPIDLRLSFALFGLECALNATLSGRECKRVFRDVIEKQVSSKQYRFFESSRLTISGWVDGHEPETISLRVEGPFGIGDTLRRVVEASEFAVMRMQSDLESPDA